MSELNALLRSTSRTFSVGIEALPAELREAVTLAYLLLRVSDYYEDSPTLSDQDKHRCLVQWAELVAEAGDGIDPERCDELQRHVAPADRNLPDHQAAVEAGAILTGLASLPAAFRVPIQRHTVDTTLGMAQWTLRGDDIPDEAALDAYMFEVAGRVGLLLTDVFSVHSEPIRARSRELNALAVSFGLGLQTVNVIRGLHEDPARGWNFVPRSLLRTNQVNVDPRTLPADDQERILDFLVRKAGRHIADAIEYCANLPRRERGIRIFCIIPALLASRTAQLSQANLAVFRTPVKAPRDDVRKLVIRTRALFFSNWWLDRHRDAARRLAAGSPPSGPISSQPPANGARPGPDQST